jgi:hypothetical protein
VEVGVVEEEEEEEEEEEQEEEEDGKRLSHQHHAEFCRPASTANDSMTKSIRRSSPRVWEE